MHHARVLLFAAIAGAVAAALACSTGAVEHLSDVGDDGGGGGGGGGGGDAGASNKLTAPYSAKVFDGTKTRVMVGKVTSGDCNFCHTAAGKNGAPGRILAP